jgi:hypothetical protein
MQSTQSNNPNPIFNDQVNNLVQLAIAAPDRQQFFQRYLNDPKTQFTATIAQRIVAQQENAAKTQAGLQAGAAVAQTPSVLDQYAAQQQASPGLAGMPTTRDSFTPDAFMQGGIGAGLGLGEEEQPPAGPVAYGARGGVVAFAKGGIDDLDPRTASENQIDPRRIPETSAETAAREARIAAALERNAARTAAEATPSATEATRPVPTQPAEPSPAPNKAELKAAKEITKLDGKIENAINKGKDPTKFKEQQRVLTEGIGSRTPVPTVQASGIAAPGPTANPTVQAVTAPAAPAAPAGGGVPPQAPPPGAAAASAAPGTPPSGATAAPATTNNRATLNSARSRAAKLGGQGLDYLAKQANKLPFARYVPGMLRAIPGVGTVGALGATVGREYIGDPLVNLVDPEGRISESVSDRYGQFAEAEEAAQGITKPVPQSDIDAFRKVQQEAKSVLPIPETLQVIRQRESGNRNLVNPLSGASGPGQMVEGTFKLLQKKYPELKKYSWEEYKKESKVQDAADMALLKDQEVTLKNLGQTPNPTNHAIVWFGGPKLLTAKADAPIESVFSEKEVAQNPNVKGKTAGQVRSMIAAGMSGQKAVPEKSTAGNLADLALQTPRNAALALGADPDAAGAIPATRSELGDYMRRAFSLEELGRSAGTGLNLARLGTTNLMESVFGLPKSEEKPTNKPTPTQTKTAQEFMQDEENQRAAASKAAQMTGDAEERKRISMALMVSGAGALAGVDPNALVNLGAGFGAGLKEYGAQEEKREARAATSLEKSRDRAEKYYKDEVQLALGVRKGAIPNFDQTIDLQTALAKLEIAEGMPPSMRRLVGIDDAELERLRRRAKILQTATPVAGGKGNAPPSDIAAIQERYRTGT